MPHPSLPDLLTVIVAARQSRRGDRERHLERAESMARAMLAPQPRAGMCERDGEPCVPECTRALAGRCGRVA